jgi:uncharacterized protein GlcG (DUF336 family)
MRPGELLPSLAIIGCLGCSASATQGQTEQGVPPAPAGAARASCNQVPSASDLRKLVRDAPGKGEAGGFAGGRFSWAAVVNRDGVLCAVAVSSDDPSATWPGSLGVAEAKAYTANAFSSDSTPMSTARLYTLSLPGHTLWGIASGNPLNPACMGTPHDPNSGVGKVCGGTIGFGGGVPLYRKNAKIGGLGVSGDTACTDHEMAKRIRDAAGLNPPKGAAADDIQYSAADGASVFTHPVCVNTWRNGKKIGDEPPASGY